ncbi:CPBP family intramembrane metalloprotease [Parasphingopyxis algicola]|uniref:CPBP family intramembrane glutamic endopeptidase n=1 Tax=Parasphingopyxis algicola TaxID=2026624 RepID=UPI0015A2F9C9|nr:type II CAAX endopeptidase family protein [Parasphingopyxis algicola]QLC26666.1 CPBP family intramembrane metalloprotease [Parasphingopyxis algicola]
MVALQVESKGWLRALLQIILFILVLAGAVAPLLLVPNSLIQFLLATMVLVALLFVWARHVDRRPFSDYGLMPFGRLLSATLAGLVIGTVSVAIVFGVSVALGAIEVSELPVTIAFAAILSFFLKMLVVGVWEEIFFRGFLFTSLRDVFASKSNARAGIFGALLVSSLAFGIAHSMTDHASIASLAILAVNGAMLCIPFVLTGNLGLSIGFHAAWNFAQSKIFGFAMSGNPAEGSLIAIEQQGPVFWTGGAYGPEAGLAGLLGLAVGLALFVAVIALFPRLTGKSGTSG